MTFVYKIEFSRKAEKDFAAFDKQVQKMIFEKLLFFQEQDNPFDFAVKLSGTDNKYRFRIGDYRVVFSKMPDGKLILLVVLKIAHRKDVYR